MQTPASERTGWTPALIPEDSVRTSARISTASTAYPARAARGSHGRAAHAAPESESAPRTGPSTTSSPDSTPAPGSAPMTTARTPYAASQPRPGGGACSCHGPRAWVAWRSAGEPDQYSAAGTSPTTREPGATSAWARTTAPGARVL